MHVALVVHRAASTHRDYVIHNGRDPPAALPLTLDAEVMMEEILPPHFPPRFPLIEGMQRILPAPRIVFLPLLLRMQLTALC